MKRRSKCLYKGELDKQKPHNSLSSEEEHVQKEPSLQEQPEPRVTNEQSKEAQIVECVQKPSQEVEDQTIGSTKTETIEEEPSQ